MKKDGQKKPVSRLIILALLLLAMMGLLVFQLFRVTIAQGESFAEEAGTLSARSVVIKGKRGDILDRNGLVLAYDEACFNVEFLRNPNRRTTCGSRRPRSRLPGASSARWAGVRTCAEVGVRKGMQ